MVETFSDIRQFDDLETLSITCEGNSQRVVAREMQNNSKTKGKAAILNNNIRYTDDRIKKVSEDIDNLEHNIRTYDDIINQIETIHEASAKWQDIKKRISSLEEKINNLQRFQIDYNTQLLDDYWILKPFSGILHEYSGKVSALGSEKRRQERQEDCRRGEEKAKREVIEGIQQLANGVEPLPWNLPDRETMMEMIRDEVCKVCGRRAPKNSDPYNFMVNKLNEYMNHIQQASVIKDEQHDEVPDLFKHSYIEELNSRKNRFCDSDAESWIAKLTPDIYDTIQDVNKRKEQLAQWKKDLQDAKTDRDNLLIQSPGLTAEALDKSFSDYSGNYEAKISATSRLAELRAELKILKTKRDDYWSEFNSLESTSSMAYLYQRIHEVFNMILAAVEKAKENNIESFITLLQDNANEYLQKLNINDFHGIIKLRRRPNGSAELQLESSNGTLITNPNGALKTTMYMSLLFAVSKITTLKRDKDYPLIFDAPTSSFEDVKEEVFYNVIDKIEKQCIIATKDLLVNRGDGARELNIDKINQLSCSVYRIQKADGFDEHDLSTIQTTITKIK